MGEIKKLVIVQLPECMHFGFSCKKKRMQIWWDGWVKNVFAA